jgi:hypothetical protein
VQSSHIPKYWFFACSCSCWLENLGLTRSPEVDRVPISLVKPVGFGYAYFDR